jgi:ElaA protein
MASQLTWTLRFFDALTPFELYRILNLRNEVFVIEQNCLYLDTDEKDLQAWHLMGWNESGALMAYCRLLPPGVSYDQMSIGRVVTHADARNTGAGKELMQRALQQCKEVFGAAEVKIGAQLYLKGF